MAKNLFDNFVNSLITDIAGKAKTFLNIIMKPNMTIDELAESCSKELDKKIIEEKKKELKYRGGILKFSYKDEKYFTMGYELYFKNKQDKWVKVSADNEQEIEFLNEKSIEEIKKKNTIQYDIEEPKEEKANKKEK